MKIKDYILHTHNGKNALVHPDHQDPVSAALLTGEGCEPTTVKGRTRLMRFPYPDGHGLVRAYTRGGVVRHFLKDTYPFVNRPLLELKILCYLHEKVLPVPLPLGVCWEQTPLGYRGALATQELSALPLVDYLGDTDEDPKEVLAQCGKRIRTMHELGVFHADLQVRNILVSLDGIYLIDFDNARKAQSLGRHQRARNLLRLRRSIEKNRMASHVFDEICAGYGEIQIPAWLSMLYTLRGLR